jgi:hypothetical protein
MQQYDGHPEARKVQDAEIEYNNTQPNCPAVLATQ